MTLDNEGVRREQYMSALHRWIECPIRQSRVVLVENSGEDLERLAGSALRGARGRWPTLISAPQPGVVAERGKGAAEAAMIDYALSRLDGLEDDHVLFKITGRLYVRNANRIIPALVDCKQIFVRATLNWASVDTRFFGATGDVWREHLQLMQNEVDERTGVFLEHVVARRSLNAAWSDGVAVRRFVGRPAFVGYDGTTGANYGGLRRAVRHSAIAPFEAFLRRIPPEKLF